MFLDYVKSLQGVVTICQVLIGVLCQLLIQFQWIEYWGLVAIFFIEPLPAEILVFFILFVCNLAVMAVFVTEAKGPSLVETFGKLKVVLFHACCFILLIIAASIHTYYLSITNGNVEFRTRYIIGDIILFAISFSHVFLGILAFMR